MKTVYSAMFHNFFIKTLALSLALLTWSYIAGQLYTQAPKNDEHLIAVVELMDRNVIVKRLPVQVNLKGTPNRRFKVAVERIKVSPSECVITGPLELIEKLSFVTTEPIGVNGISRSINRKKISIKSIPGCTIPRMPLSCRWTCSTRCRSSGSSSRGNSSWPGFCARPAPMACSDT